MGKRKTGKREKRAAGRPGGAAALAVAVLAAALVVFYARGGFAVMQGLLKRPL